MKPLSFNVAIDCSGLVAAIVLTAIIVAKTDRSLTSFFVVPLILLGVHVYGNTVQELQLGPEWIRNHLHNTGVAGLSLIWSQTLSLSRMSSYRGLGYAQRRIKTAQTAMNMSLYYWSFSTLTGFGIEILTVTIWGDDYKAKGYSGELDWFDLSAYAIGATIVTLNYLWFKPRILKKMQRRHIVGA